MTDKYLLFVIAILALGSVSVFFFWLIFRRFNRNEDQLNEENREEVVHLENLVHTFSESLDTPQRLMLIRELVQQMGGEFLMKSKAGERTTFTCRLPFIAEEKMDDLVKKERNPVLCGDDSFLKGINQIIEHHMDDSDFNVGKLAEKIGMNRSSLHRKIKAITGKSTALYIRSYRLHHARQLLILSDLQVSEVAWKTGFNSLSWFDQAYHKEFNESPSATRD